MRKQMAALREELTHTHAVNAQLTRMLTDAQGRRAGERGGDREGEHGGGGNRGVARSDGCSRGTNGISRTHHRGIACGDATGTGAEGARNGGSNGDVNDDGKGAAVVSALQEEVVILMEDKHALRARIKQLEQSLRGRDQ